MCVLCVCVCVCERETERESVCVCVCGRLLLSTYNTSTTNCLVSLVSMRVCVCCVMSVPPWPRRRLECFSFFANETQGNSSTIHAFSDATFRDPMTRRITTANRASVHTCLFSTFVVAAVVLVYLPRYYRPQDG